MKISVITVAFNSASTIADTLTSVAAQTHSDIEHIVIDGQSTDDTVSVVKAHQHPQLTLSSEPDDGIYDAMNKGLRRACGEVIGFLNADDLFADEQVLARVAAAFESPEISACFGDLVYVTKDNQKIVRFWKSKPFQKGYFANGWCPAHPTFYIRRSALERLGAFDLTYLIAADAEFMMRYLESGGIQATYIPHVQVRMRVGGASNKSWSNVVAGNREIFNALRKNAIPYSTFLFWAHKIASRLRQRLTAKFKN